MNLPLKSIFCSFQGEESCSSCILYASHCERAAEEHRLRERERAARSPKTDSYLVN